MSGQPDTRPHTPQVLDSRVRENDGGGWRPPLPLMLSWSKYERMNSPADPTHALRYVFPAEAGNQTSGGPGAPTPTRAGN